MENYFRTFAIYEQNNWTDRLSMAIFVINNQTLLSTLLNPFYFTYEYNVESISIIEPIRSSGNSPIVRKKAFVQQLKEISNTAQTAIAAVQKRQKQYANISR